MNQDELSRSAATYMGDNRHYGAEKKHRPVTPTELDFANLTELDFANLTELDFASLTELDFASLTELDFANLTELHFANLPLCCCVFTGCFILSFFLFKDKINMILFVIIIF